MISILSCNNVFPWVATQHKDRSLAPNTHPTIRSLGLSLRRRRFLGDIRCTQWFQERLSIKMHATVLKGILSILNSRSKSCPRNFFLPYADSISGKWEKIVGHAGMDMSRVIYSDILNRWSTNSGIKNTQNTFRDCRVSFLPTTFLRIAVSLSRPL